MNKQYAKGELAGKYGARYHDEKNTSHDTARVGDLYFYDVFVGKQSVSVDIGDSLIYIDLTNGKAHWVEGPRVVESSSMAVRLRGYSCGEKSNSILENVNLPYINGCASKQIFHPERVGDPTLQQLTIPPYTSEQSHHIHPTARVVYVLSGRGHSIIGQSHNTEETELLPGMVCVLDPMCPHHFRTDDEFLTVLPVHVFSSGSSDEFHPMRNGTKEV